MRDRGASAVEYAILVAATAAVLVIGALAFKDVLTAVFMGTCNNSEVVGTNPDGTQVHAMECS